MRIVFPFEEKESNIFPKIKRPVAVVCFWSKLINGWLGYTMIVDTGADFTILPRYRSLDLGVNLEKDCFLKTTSGVGGKMTLFFLKKKAKIKIGNFQLEIPLGFLNSNTVPPLLGREQCLNILRVTFVDFQTEFLSR